MPLDPHTLSLLFYPAPVLRQQAEEVDPTDLEVQAVAHRMIEIMYKYDGAGLAAPQVGLPWRLFVTRPPQFWEASEPEKDEGTDNERSKVLGVAWINPTIEIVGGEYASKEEGCLSLPEIHGNVRRSLEVNIAGFDITGMQVDSFSDQFIARVWQHEFDHLEGVLIIDKMSAMDRLVNRRQIRQLERAF